MENGNERLIGEICNSHVKAIIYTSQTLKMPIQHRILKYHYNRGDGKHARQKSDQHGRPASYRPLLPTKSNLINPACIPNQLSDLCDVTLAISDR